jgi:hypothetical protein
MDHFLRSLFDVIRWAGATRPARTAARVRPTVEPLEGRTLLSGFPPVTSIGGHPANPLVIAIATDPVVTIGLYASELVGTTVGLAPPNPAPGQGPFGSLHVDSVQRNRYGGGYTLSATYTILLSPRVADHLQVTGTIGEFTPSLVYGGKPVATIEFHGSVTDATGTEEDVSYQGIVFLGPHHWRTSGQLSDCINTIGTHCGPVAVVGAFV